LGACRLTGGGDPVKPDGDDASWHLLATHPKLDARIARLAALFPSGVEPAKGIGDEPLPVPATAGPEG
jgi:hypothetical protein